MRKSGRLPLEALAPYLLEVPPAFNARAAARLAAASVAWYAGKKPLDWPELFGRSRPVEIEIGFGKGLFLLNASEARPEHDFLGIEKERDYTLFTATRLAKRERRNVRVVCADARWFVAEWLADASVDHVHIYFPDPWWKKRHHKRRLFNEEFATRLTQLLKGGGRLHFATDVPEYFAMTMAMLRVLPALTEAPAPPQSDPRHDMDYLTNFERKFRLQAKPIHRALFERR
ncbi:MAG: tRNA (guanosine(46)-N7)-methyltransferase TrmB [Gemmataceae bacterium]